MAIATLSSPTVAKMIATASPVKQPRFEVKLDLTKKNIEVYFHPNNASITILLDEYRWKLNGHLFRLTDFGSLIKEVTNYLFAGYKPGKFAKCKLPNVPLTYFVNKNIKLVSKILSPELHKLLLLVNKRYLKLDKAITRAFGFKRGTGDFSIFFTKDFIKSKNYKAAVKYPIALYAVYQSQDINCDWKRYYCYKNKLTKDYLLTIKSIKYPIQLRLLSRLKDKPIPKAITNRTELFWYFAWFQSFRSNRNICFILDATDKDIKWSVKKLRDSGFKRLNLRSYTKIEEFVNVLVDHISNKVNSLKELTMYIHNKTIQDTLKKIQVNNLKHKLMNPFDLSKYGFQPVKTFKELLKDKTLFEWHPYSYYFFFKKKNKILYFDIESKNNQLQVGRFQSQFPFKDREQKNLIKDIEAQIQLHAKLPYVT